MARDQWYIRNISNRNVNIGDIQDAPVVSPGQRYDLLRYAEMEEILQSQDLLTAIQNQWVVVDRTVVVNGIENVTNTWNSTNVPASLNSRYHASQHAPGGPDPITAASIMAIPDTAKTLTITYNGQWQTPLVMDTDPQSIMVSGNHIGGSQTSYSASNVAGVYQIAYSENSSIIGNLTSLSFDTLQFTIGGINLSNLPLLTTFAATGLVTSPIIIATVPSLTSIVLSNLVTAYCNNIAGSVPSGGIYIANATALTTLSLSNLVTAFGSTTSSASVTGGVFINGVPVLTTLSLPNLVTAYSCGSGNASYGLNLAAAPTLTTLSLPNLVTANGFSTASGSQAVGVYITSASALTTLSLPNLVTAYGQGTVGGSGVTVQSCGNMATISLPSLITIYGYVTALSCSNSNGNIVTLQFGTIGTLKTAIGDLIASGQKLNQSSVDGALASLASLDGSNGTYRYGTGRVVSLSSGTSLAPTYTGDSPSTTSITVAVPDAYRVTGTGTPDATGVYVRNGSYGGQPAYTSELGDYNLYWCSGIAKWVISPTPSGTAPSTGYWSCSTITGSFTPTAGTWMNVIAGSYSGTMTSAACTQATATLATSHGYSTGDLVTIAGTAPTGLSGTFKITVTAANIFTYYCATTTIAAIVQGTCRRSSPASGAYQNIGSISGDGTTATVTLNSHGYSTGKLVTITGMTPSTFNGQFVITNTGTNTFTYPCIYNGNSTISGQVKQIPEGFYHKQVLLFRGATVSTN